MQKNFIKQCKVCGSKENVCFHFGVCTCRACGAFFRRYIDNGEVCKFKCICWQKPLSKENKDGKSQTNLEKCKKCRLDKCLLVGMKNVLYLRHDINLEAMEKQKNRITLQNPPIVDITINDRQQINSILPIIEAKKRIMHAFNDLDDIFLKGPILFEEILLSDFNIFRLVGNFSPNPSPIPLDEVKSWETSLQAEGMLNNRYHKYLLVDRLLIVGIAKSIPVFIKLTLTDQVFYINFM
ncbi:unnamed protein product [Meloidogyne enterolobii]|uniref:Uncharacterized protein n=1 Tax=Meloidogyne enterolobii TaxID=390850 RepID=A0ACB0XRV2_MELEN